MFEELTKFGMIVPGFLVELLVAIICGGLIGLERGVHHKAISLRDNILICIGSVMYMNISELIILGSGEEVVSDPGRIAAQIIIGIGLIGAGVIIREREEGAGLTTAATIWVVGAIGLIIGANQWLLGLLITGLILLIMMVLNSIERNLVKQPRPMLLKMIVRHDGSELRQKVSEILEKEGVQIISFHAENAPVGVKLTIQGSNEPRDIRPLIGKLWTIKDVTDVEH